MASSGISHSKTEVTHFIGGPCEEEKVACCVVASASGYSIVQAGLEVDLSVGRTWGIYPPVTENWQFSSENMEQFEFSSTRVAI